MREKLNENEKSEGVRERSMQRVGKRMREGKGGDEEWEENGKSTRRKGEKKRQRDNDSACEGQSEMEQPNGGQ